jgi:hypothetical protein
LLRTGVLLRVCAMVRPQVLARPGVKARVIVRRFVYLSIIVRLLEAAGSRLCLMAEI